MNIFKLLGARRDLKNTLRHARNIFHMREDLLAPGERAHFTGVLADARGALRSGDAGEMRAVDERLNEAVQSITPQTRLAGVRGFFETWVTALAVAMAFRAYFYQPFRIPTNSMYPTLNGITSVDEPPDWAESSPVTQIPKWLLTGSWHKEIRATSGGILEPMPRGPGYREKPGYTTLLAGGVPYFIPSDVFIYNADAGRYVPRDGRVPLYQRVSPGQMIWSGRVIIGDFVFVNRWIWNLRRPRRGEVMVFSTQGIKGLQQGTHYIKRMCGVPNETLEIRDPDLIINGRAFAGHPMIRRIAARETLGDWAPPYHGYANAFPSHDFPAPVLTRGASVQLGPADYFALGDNTRSSLDSRYWGVVPEKNLLGPGAVVYWPFINPRWGRIP